MWKKPSDTKTYDESYIALELLDITGYSDAAWVMLRAAACCNEDQSNTLGIDIITDSYAKSFYLYEDEGGSNAAYIKQTQAYTISCGTTQKVCHLSYYRADQIELVYLDFSGLPDILPTATYKYITTVTGEYGEPNSELFHASATLMGQSAPRQYFTYTSTNIGFSSSGGIKYYVSHLNDVSMI